MKKSAVLLLFIAVLSLMLYGCRSGKKFESAESMISSMEGIYSASGDHSGEYIIISQENVIIFNIDNIFPQEIDEDFFNDNFSDEHWEDFSIEVLLDKPYVDVITKATVADTENSLLSGFWIEKDGTLYSQQENGYPYEKISSEPIFPTDEMIEKFAQYCLYLQEYEISSIIREAEEDYSEKKEAAESELSDAPDAVSSKGESTASDKTIAECAFDSLKSSFKYPATATMDGYGDSPEKDPYGRVATSIRCTYQNGIGDYITKDIYVVLQSCSSSGDYTYKFGSHYYVIENEMDDIDALGVQLTLSSNDWGSDPDYDAEKESVYLEAIGLAEAGDYGSAIEKLESLGGYRSSEKVVSACKSYIHSQDYKNAIDLFANKQYSEAAEKLASLSYIDGDGYLRTGRVIYLCQYFGGVDVGNNSGSSNEDPKENIGIGVGENDTDDQADPDNKDSDAVSDGNDEVGNSAGDDTGDSSESANNGDGSTSTVHTHSYTAATCTAPQTCTVCGATNGSAAGHNWTEITQLVHHDEVGHYEEVKVEKKVEKYRCFLCGYKVKYSTLSEYYAHFDSTHSDELNAGRLRELYDVVEDWEYSYEKKWVVDTKAYDETVTTGYKCSVCGQTK